MQVREFPEVDHVEEEDMVYGSQTESDSKDDNTLDKNDIFWFLERLNYVSDDQHVGVPVDVYVLDTGINFDHQEFENRAKYIGYDPMDEFLSDSQPEVTLQKGRDCNGHGTLVASLIGGKTYGVAKNANLFSIRVLGCDKKAPLSIVLDGLDLVASEALNSKSPAVVIMPFVGSKHFSIESSIKILSKKNILVVAPAGNSHSGACDQYPARLSSVLTVGATDQENNISPYSNFGSCVNIFAPGESITGASSTCPTCKVNNVNGTSLSAALVCGIAAVHLSSSPLIDAVTLKRKIIDSSSFGLINFATESEKTSPNQLANLGK